MQLLFDNIQAQCYNTYKPIKSVRENGSSTTQQPALQGANAETMGIIAKLTLLG